MQKVTRHSYGIVPLFKSDTGIEVLLILQSRLGPKVWGFPKGTPEDGESSLETALRETKEEIGSGDIDLVPGFSYTESYVFTETDGATVHKQVTYFAGFLQDKNVTPQMSEVDAYGWFPFDDAHEKITFPETRAVLESLRSHMKF